MMSRDKDKCRDFRSEKSREELECRKVRRRRS